MPAKRLRPVAAGETAPAPVSVSDAVERFLQGIGWREDGTEVDVSVAELRVVARRIDKPDTADRDMAALTKRRRDLMADIRQIGAREGACPTCGHGQEGGKRARSGDEAWTAI